LSRTGELDSGSTEYNQAFCEEQPPKTLLNKQSSRRAAELLEYM